VIWSRESFKQLIEIEEFISRDSSERASKFVDRIIDRGERIKDYPFKGRIVPEFTMNEIREVFEKSYRIVYKISENQIEILTVFEGHQILKSDKIDWK
jgi:plasmid stabilization system protein ParE